jgi:dihydrofolate synthase/folylpolyglutamate synthase
MVLKGADQEEWALGLDRIRCALERLGHPERSYKTVLVAGTNGKGSTCIFLERMLVTSGLSVGTNLSPHVSRYVERFKLNSRYVQDQEIVDLEREMEPLLKDVHLTYFEWCVAIACVLFARHNVDVGIFEIGLGGRLDAANAIEPQVSIITEVSIDHTDYLGNTIDAIAREKAAIARLEIPLVISAENKAIHVIKGHACSIGACLYKADAPILYNTGINGRHQGINAALALKAAEILGVRLSSGELRYAINTAFLPGRIESVGILPRRIILDVAHNPASMVSLVKYLSKIGFRGVGVLGILADKDYIKMARLLRDACTKIYMAPVRSKRSWQEHHMSRVIGLDGYYRFNSIRQAFDTALRAGEDIVITGSFYSIAEVRDKVIWQG